jgi:hypothetical protein
MRGPQQVRVSSKRCDYQFELRRNITIVRGNSGTGKTTLYDMIAEHTRLGEASGVNIQCAKACVALIDMDWQNQLTGTTDSIVFIDEGAAFITSEDFASAVRGTDNYYVLFTRVDLHQLPYSIDEIFEINTSGRKYHRFVPAYQPDEHHAYTTVPRRRQAQHFDVLLTEDSKAGLDLYVSHFDGADVSCVSAGTNAAVYQWLKDHPGERVFVVADGAAFGPEADRVLKLQALHPQDIAVCLPESFEWLILSSGLVDDASLAEILANPSGSIESADYESWEQFFSAYLARITRGTPFAYRKDRLAPAYVLPQNSRKIVDQISRGNVR